MSPLARDSASPCKDRATSSGKPQALEQAARRRAQPRCQPSPRLLCSAGTVSSVPPEPQQRWGARGGTSSSGLQGCSCSIQGSLRVQSSRDVLWALGRRGIWVWVTATGDNDLYWHRGLVPLAQGMYRSSGTEQMRGFAQRALPGALRPRRKDQCGSRGTAGHGCSVCLVGLSSGMAPFSQWIPISSHRSVGTGHWGSPRLAHTLTEPRSTALPLPSSASGRIRRCNHP